MVGTNNLRRRLTGFLLAALMLFSLMPPAMAEGEDAGEEPGTEEVTYTAALSNQSLAMKVGETKQIMGQDGKYYAVTTKADGYDILLPTGETITFVYDKKNNSWSQIQEGRKTEIFRFNQDGTIQATLPNGKKMNVTNDEAGVYEVRMAVNDGVFFAMK